MFERLTIKTDICIEPENEIVYHNPNDPDGMYNILDLAECLWCGGEAEARILSEISRRLAAYEDSGLSPEQVQEFADAKAEGRLVVLPCKVGDAVYFAREEYAGGKSIQSNEVFEIKFDARGIVIYGVPKRCSMDFMCYSDDIGKTVFLTREEADKAIGGKEDVCSK